MRSREGTPGPARDSSIRLFVTQCEVIALLIFFQDDRKGSAKKVVVNVKGGDNVDVTQTKDLIATVAREKADLGLIVTLAPAKKTMLQGSSVSRSLRLPDGQELPEIQVLTIKGLLNGKERPE